MFFFNNIEIFLIKVFVQNVTDEVLKSKRSLSFLDDWFLLAWQNIDRAPAWLGETKYQPAPTIITVSFKWDINSYFDSENYVIKWNGILIELC